jgi:multiple sugar transport system permease protein
VLILPAMILLVLMMLYPLIQTVVFSFSEVRLPDLTATFIGLENFVKIVQDPETVGLVVRTVIWVAGTVALRFVLGFAGALIFNAKVRGTIWMRILVILPWTLPSVVAANLWRWIFQNDIGVLNQSLRSIGLPNLAVDWLGDPSFTLFSVIVAYSWTGFPFVMLLILAGMQGIPQDQYEAAQMDGSNWRQIFRFITIPSLKGILAVALILEIVSAINSFDTIMVMTGGGPANATMIFGIQIYRTGFSLFDFGGASALSVFLFLGAFIVFIVYALVNRRLNRSSEDDL